LTSKFTELAIDCADPSGLARFWCSVLGYEVQEEDDGIVTIGSSTMPEGKNQLGPVAATLTFARVPEGKTIKNRLHLDVNPTDREQDEEVRRLLDLGARHADVGQTGKESWVCLADPEGTSSASLRTAAPDRWHCRGGEACSCRYWPESSSAGQDSVAATASRRSHNHRARVLASAS
jgi:Glyoxalase-like domain